VIDDATERTGLLADHPFLLISFFLSHIDLLNHLSLPLSTCSITLGLSTSVAEPGYTVRSDIMTADMDALIREIEASTTGLPRNDGWNGGYEDDEEDNAGWRGSKPLIEWMDDENYGVGNDSGK
jgi:hypothetical protein